ncbi:AAA family ATPase [Pseudomonas paraeruginosa]|uniref:AAA family ATPase n=1 Tax=Pseudomonas paraeruginosa TaxID=2994495 RepID=UPI0039FD2747
MKILAIRLKNLASLGGEQEIDFTREPLSSAGLFAITGPTGAGKSTVLDALCLALFGSAPRLESTSTTSKVPDGRNELSSNDERNLLRRGCASGYAEVDFVGIDGRRYRARWETRRARDKVDGQLQASRQSLQDLDSRQMLAANKKSEFREQLEQKLGLNFAQFTRAVLLAQSEFSAFLKANDNDRGALLEKLTDTGLYSQLSKAAYQRASLADEQRKQLEQRLEGSLPLAEQARTELESTLANHTQARQQEQQALQRLENQQQWFLEERRLALSCEQAQRQLAEARHAWDGLAAERETLQQLERLAPVRGLLQRLEQLGQDLLLSQEQHRQQSQRHTAGSERLLQLQSQLHEARQRQAAAESTLREAQGPLREAFQLEAEASRLERTLSEQQTLHRQSNERHAQQCEAIQRLESERQRSAEEQTQLRAALQQSSALATLGDAWPTQQGQFAAFLQRRQRSAESRALLPELENALAQAAEPLGQLQEKWVALHGSDTDDLAARLDELRQQTSGLEQSQALYKEWQQGLGRRADLVRRLAELGQRLVAQEQQLLELKQQGSQCAEQVKAAEQALHLTRELLQRQRLARSASVEQLRAGLVEGEACPVCGSQEHPYHHPERLLAALGEADDQEQARAEQALEQQRGALGDLRERYSSQREKLNQSRHEQQELTEQLAALDRQLGQWTLPGELLRLEPAAQLEWLGTRLDELAEQRQHSQQDFDRLIARQRQAQQLRQQLRAAEATLQQRQQALHEQQQRCEHLRQQVEEDDQQLRLLLSAEHWQRWQDAPEPTFQALAQAIEQRRHQQDRLLQVEQQLQELERRGDELQWQLKQNDEQRSQARQAEEQTQAELAGLRGRLGAHLGRHTRAQDWQQALENAVQAAQATVETLQAPLDTLREEQLRLGEALEHLQHQQSRQQEERQRLQADWQAWREGQENLDDSRLDALLALPDAQARQWREHLQQLQEEITRQRTLEAERQEQLQQHRRQRPELDHEALEDILRQQRERLAASEQAYLDAYSQLQADNQRREQSQALLAELEQARAEFRRWGRLNELIGSSSGDKFRRIAQGYNLDLLVQHSNVQLRQLARRYRLQRGGSELGLLVVDTEMGDELRSVYSLSGGETFLISLALALGLASMASSKLRIESLFIDEGFGSLDPESLQLAMDALDNLQAQGRKVAVISHVQEMHERIPVQVRVQREGNGMSSLKVVG